MAKKAATKAVAKKEEVTGLVETSLSSSAMAQHLNFDDSLFAGVKLDVQENNEIFSNDILIPKVWLVQAMSEVRKDGKAQEGQFIDSQSHEVLADLGGELRLVVLKTFKRWHTFKLVKKGNEIKKEFVSSEIMVFGKNHDLAYEDTIEGEQVVRRQVISAYVLLEKDVSQGINKPYIIDFASSSKGAGRKMVTDIKTLNNAKKPSFVGWFKLTASEQSFDAGTAFVKDMNFGGFFSTVEQINFLLEAYNSLGEIEDQIVIDDADVIDSANTVEAEKVETKVGKKAKASDAGI